MYYCCVLTYILSLTLIVVTIGLLPSSTNKYLQLNQPQYKHIHTHTHT